MSELDLALSIALGVGLAAATGFRVFVPLLIMSIAARAGYLPLGESFAWLATTSALVMLSIAALIEVLAYYIPGVDNLLDTLATPGAVLAGIIASAAVMSDLPPMLQMDIGDHRRRRCGGPHAGCNRAATRAFDRLHGRDRQSGDRDSGTWRRVVIVSLVALAAPFIALALVVIFCILAVRFVRELVAAATPCPRVSGLPSTDAAAPRA